jgi:hypothetical protein
MPRIALAACLAVALAAVPAASSGTQAAGIAKGVPSALHAFLLRSDEPVQANHTYAQMPAFAWKLVPNAANYQLQLADNKSFSDVSILYQARALRTPVASIQVQLPWMNGDPYALWVHVRATVNGVPTRWSKPFGFNMSWESIPEQESAPTGLLRWTPVNGATAYQVWFTNINRSFMTFTNVADEREYWTLHPSLGSTVKWRVRAIRRTASSALPSGIAITPYGPWSDVFTTLTSGTVTKGPLRQGHAISDVQSPAPNALMPGFAWSGTDGVGPNAIGQQLWRVYVFSDKRCVNQVMVGALTGTPAWAPRATQALTFPGSVKELLDTEAQGKILKYGAEGATFMADLNPVTASENAGAASASAPATPSGASSSSASPASSTTTPASTGSSSTIVASGQVELPDSGWPTGRYWWTVVPVYIDDIFADGASSSDPGDSLEYHDAELPQDACKAGRVWPFALRSAPVTASARATPYASGLSLSKRLVAAAGRNPSFVQLPLITWKPAIGAQSYEVELSRHTYPWVAAKKLTSVVTSAVLPLTKNNRGTWYYRVRGVNPNLPANAQKMTWSSSVPIRISGNLFAVLH